MTAAEIVPMRPTSVIVVSAIALGLGGCANMTTTEQRTVSGAAIGALGGTAIAAIAEHNLATGAAIGAGVGAAAGYLYSLSHDRQHVAYHATNYHRRVARTKKPPTPEKPSQLADQRLASAQ